MKIREICNRGLFTETDLRFFKTLADREIAALIQFGPEHPSLVQELERRREERRKKNPLIGGPGISSPPSNDVAATSAEAPADAAGPAASAPLALGGPRLG